MGNEIANLVGDLRLHADGLVPLVNSRDVAESFGKRHDNVLRNINGLDLSSDLRTAWFRPVTYIGEDGTERPSYDMTRDGFTLLVMGWTGAKAMKFKVAYIQAFNAMEQELKARPVPQGGITAQELLVGLKEAIAPLAVRFDSQDQALERVVERVDNRFDAVESRVNILDEKISYIGRNKPKKVKQETKRSHIEDIFDMGGKCPCCSVADVVDTGGNKLPFADFDHFWANSVADGAHTWLICKPCHNALTNGKVTRSSRTSVFNAYQDRRLRLPGRQPVLFGNG